jgi:hypothetical protein
VTRLYFRCTYKDDRGCMARRQVQQSDTDPDVYLIIYFDEHTCCRDDSVEPPPPAPFVINFGLSTASSDDQPSGRSPWPSSCDDDGPVETHTSSALCSSPEEEFQAGTSCNAAEFIVEQSTPVPELMGMMHLPEWEWDPMDGCLDWEFGKGESSFDIDGFVRYDFHYIDLL